MTTITDENIVKAMNEGRQLAKDFIVNILEHAKNSDFLNNDNERLIFTNHALANVYAQFIFLMAKSLNLKHEKEIENFKKSFNKMIERVSKDLKNHDK